MPGSWYQPSTMRDGYSGVPNADSPRSAIVAPRHVPLVRSGLENSKPESYEKSAVAIPEEGTDPMGNSCPNDISW